MSAFEGVDTSGLSPDELAQLQTLQDAVAARKAAEGADALVAPGPLEVPVAATEPTHGYEFNVGEVVKTSLPNNAAGYGLVVERRPMSSPTPGGETLAGYKVAAFGPCNDMPATAEDLGISKVVTDEVTTEQV